MDIAIVTGSAGLVGSETVRFLAGKGMTVVGIDNDMRRQFFGEAASTAWNRADLIDQIKDYTHLDKDIRDQAEMERLFSNYGSDIKLIVHAAAQPSHDWAATDPHLDFTVNANGTLTLLELMRVHCPKAVFIFTSTNKVYGDTPNRLPLVEEETRWEVEEDHPYYRHGIDETMSIDQSKHSLFGVSKVAADILVQEYGRYFDLHTACFRGGCLTGPNHSGAQLHGFLAYLMQCALSGEGYTVFGYKGKQVRDNIHSFDFVNMFWHYYRNPRKGEVYNAGGGRHSNCSMLEAITLIEKISGSRIDWSYSDTNRIGDHVWWISDMRKFREHYPEWEYKFDLNSIIASIYEGITERNRTR